VRRNIICNETISVARTRDTVSVNSMKTTTVATRLSTDALAAFHRDAAKRGVSLSTHLRQAVATLLSTDAVDPDKKLAAVANLLGLPLNSTADQIIEAISALGDGDPEVTGAKPADPLAQLPDAPPPPHALLSSDPRVRAAHYTAAAKLSSHYSRTELSALSPQQRVALAARGMTIAQFHAAKAAMPRTGQPKKAK
jgi:hypothetical protein